MIDIFVIPELPNMLAQWAATIVLFLVIRHFVYAPMKEFLAKRQAAVSADLEAARKDRAEAEAMRANFEKDLREAKDEGNRIIEESRQRGKEIERQLTEEGRAQAERLLEKARGQIDKEKEMAYREVKNSTSDMAVAIAEKLLRRQLDDKGQDAMVDDLLAELETTHV